MNEDLGSVGILFVDDEELSRKYFKRFFGQRFPVFCAEDGKSAIEVFLAHREQIGIVVSDQMMPVMTGLALLEEIRKIDGLAVRILSTAYADSEEVEHAKESGLVEYFITKPWDLPKLEETLADAKEHRSQRTESAA